MFERMYLVSAEDLSKIDKEEVDTKKRKVLDYETIYNAVVKCQEEKASEEILIEKKQVNKWLKFKLK